MLAVPASKLTGASANNDLQLRAAATASTPDRQHHELITVQAEIDGLFGEEPETQKGDHTVDARDVAAISTAARGERPRAEADVDCDGTVNEQDAALLQEHWATRTPLPCRTLAALTGGGRHTCVFARLWSRSMLW